MSEGEWLVRTKWEKECYERVVAVHRILGREFSVMIQALISSSYLTLGYPEGGDYKVSPGSLPNTRPDYGNVNFEDLNKETSCRAHLDNHIKALRCYNVFLSDEQKRQLANLNLTVIEEEAD